jgi:hypothetical protein
MAVVGAQPLGEPDGRRCSPLEKLNALTVEVHQHIYHCEE